MRAKMKEVEDEDVEDVAEVTPVDASAEKPAQQVVIRLNIKLIVAVVILVVVAVGLFLAKGLFVAAVVNGKPISRLAVIQELEKRSGKQALDAMITQMLVDDELKKKNISVSEEEVAAEIQKFEAQVAQQGGTLEQLLDQQGSDRQELAEQIARQKKLEKLFESTVTVTDEEVATAIKGAQLTVPEGEEGAAMTAQVKEQLRTQKINDEINKWIEGLKSASSIKYVMQY